MPGRRTITLLGLAALALAWTSLATGGTAVGLASALPILLLLVPLLARRYPGERQIERLRGARGNRPAPTRARALDARAPRPTRRVTARGGLLLASGLAVRPPPAAPAHA